MRAFYVREIHRLFSIDIRSLALLRVLTMILIIIDLIIRAEDIKYHYSDVGVLSRIGHYENVNHNLFSIHLYSGLPYMMWLLFIIAGVFAIFVLIGYRTRIFTVLSWIMLVSLQNRNPMVLQGGDTLLAMIMFWGMFSHWGNYYSIDSYSKRRDHITVIDYGCVALMIQICVVYVFAYLLKTGAEWREDYTAVYYALSNDQMALELAYWLLDYPKLLKILTICVLYFEGAVAFLLFFPIFTHKVRICTIVSLTIMHLSFGLSLRLGLFPYIDIVALAVFIPSKFWDFLSQHKILIPVKVFER